MKFYHKTGCPICAVAQAKLDQKHINYEDCLVDINNPNDSNMAQLQKLNIKQFPVLITDNDEIISGAQVSKWVNAQEATK